MIFVIQLDDVTLDSMAFSQLRYFFISFDATCTTTQGGLDVVMMKRYCDTVILMVILNCST